MLRHQVFAVVLGLCVVNGIFSPLVFTVFANHLIWMPLWLPPDPSVMFYLSSLLLSTMTLLVSGVIPALIERLAPAWRGSVGVTWIWVLCAAILSFPAFVRLLLISGAAA